jgi:hypothetical protein
VFGLVAIQASPIVHNVYTRPPVQGRGKLSGQTRVPDLRERNPVESIESFFPFSGSCSVS